MTHPLVHLDDPAPLAPLYAGRRTLRAIVASVLEGRSGAAVADDPTHPGVARLDHGCYAVFAGDPDHPAASSLAARVSAPIELLFPESNAESWRRRLHAVHPSTLVDRPMSAYGGHGIRIERLRDLASRIPPDYEIRRMEIEHAARLDASLEPHALQVFDSAEELIRSGFGFCATWNGRVVCQSTSYACSSRHVEQSIGTHPEHRRLGLARAVAARFLIHALEAGLTPHWNASNPISKRLALSLGYEDVGTCEVLYLPAP